METGAESGIGLFGALIYVAIIVLMIVSMWKIFVKAGRPGWAAIVPIYNTLVQLQIIGKPWWWLLMFLVPVANLIFAILMIVELAKVFGKSGGYAVGLLFLPFIFYPMLAFGEATYTDPDAPAPLAPQAV